MYCVKTGARAYIHELGGVVAADIFGVGPETLVIRWNPNSLEFIGPVEARTLGATHFVMQAPSQRDDWCRADLATMVTQRRFVEGHLCG